MQRIVHDKAAQLIIHVFDGHNGGPGIAGAVNGMAVAADAVILAANVDGIADFGIEGVGHGFLGVLNQQLRGVSQPLRIRIHAVYFAVLRARVSMSGRQKNVVIRNSRGFGQLPTNALRVLVVEINNIIAEKKKFLSVALQIIGRGVQRVMSVEPAAVCRLGIAAQLDNSLGSNIANRNTSLHKIMSFL